MKNLTAAQKINNIYKNLSGEVDKLTFGDRVLCVYNPLSYARAGHECYIKKFAHENIKGIFLGMNPGPYGMAQNGVPFGEINAVKYFLGIDNILIEQPEKIHPLYPVEGFKCARSEISGKRLWKLFQDKFNDADNFFGDYIVLNHCPLMFIARGSGKRGARNLTPDNLRKAEREKLYSVCNSALKEVLNILRPKFAIGIGKYAYDRLNEVADEKIKVVKILHPSPASPLSAKDWDIKASQLLQAAGIWS